MRQHYSMNNFRGIHDSDTDLMKNVRKKMMRNEHFYLWNY